MMEAQMTESNEVQGEEVVAVDTNDYKALYEKAQKDIEKIAAKKDELLNETKKAKQDRETAELAHRKATEEKAQKDGEFEKLWQTAKKEKDELNQRLLDIQNSNRREKIQISAMRVATELADGDNADLLSEFVQRNLDKMADEAGGLSPDVLDAVKNEFKNNVKYKSLLRSSKATGGGAPGNAKTISDAGQTLSRTEFNGLDQMARSKFLAKGGKLTD